MDQTEKRVFITLTVFHLFSPPHYFLSFIDGFPRISEISSVRACSKVHAVKFFTRQLGFPFSLSSLPSSHTRSNMKVIEPFHLRQHYYPVVNTLSPLPVPCFEVQLSWSYAIRAATSLWSYFSRVCFASPGFGRSYSTRLHPFSS